MLYRYRPLLDTLCNRIAWLLPRRILYFAVIRAWAIATRDEYSTAEAGQVTVGEVVNRLAD